MIKRIICAFLAFVMLAALIACADASDTEETTSATADESGTDIETEVVTTLEDELGFTPKDFGGDFTFACQDSSIWGWGVTDIYVEKDSAEPVDSAIFNRNLWIYDTFGCKIGQVQVSDIEVEAAKQYKAGSNDFGAYAAKTMQCANMSTKGYLNDLLNNSVPYINLEQDWWDSSTVKGLSVNGRLYYATGDLFTVDNDASTILMFNKTMLNNHMSTSEIQSTPYELVANNEWTFETFRQIALTSCLDVDNDGPQPDKDYFGITGGYEVIIALFYAAGLSTTGYDSEGNIIFALDLEKGNDYFDWAHTVLYDTTLTMIYHDVGTGVDAGVSFGAFTNGRALFYGETLDKVQGLRSSEIDFGIVPFPKQDTAQKNYYTFVNNVGHCVCIPTNCTDLEKSGMIVEAMAYKSKTTLTPAYYDINLIAKGMRDEQSEPMLDIILANRVFDLGYVFGWGNFVETTFHSVAKAGGGLSSGIKKYQKQFENAMKKTLKAYSN